MDGFIFEISRDCQMDLFPVSPTVFFYLILFSSTTLSIFLFCFSFVSVLLGLIDLGNLAFDAFSLKRSCITANFVRLVFNKSVRYIFHSLFLRNVCVKINLCACLLLSPFASGQIKCWRQLINHSTCIERRSCLLAEEQLWNTRPLVGTLYRTRY